MEKFLRGGKDMEFLPIIIVSSIGLSLCISYLLYHAVDFFRKRRKSPTIREEDCTCRWNIPVRRESICAADAR